MAEADAVRRRPGRARRPSAGVYLVYTGDAVPEWPQLVPLTVVVVQASYALITKPTATAIERR